MGARVSGATQIAKALRAAKQRYGRALSASLRAEGEALLEASKAEVPVDTGELRESGYVKAAGLNVSVGFNASHAAKVHEQIEVRHDDGKARFLMDPYNAAQDGMLDRLASKMKDKAGGGDG